VGKPPTAPFRVQIASGWTAIVRDWFF